MQKIREFLGLTYYTSELDQFLQDFDKRRPQLSDSQRAEKNKYQTIYQLRDSPAEKPIHPSKIWEKF